MPAPVTEISLKDLRRMGLGDLAVADLNGDGLLNVDDMTAYENGATPQQVDRSIRKRLRR